MRQVDAGRTAHGRVGERECLQVHNDGAQFIDFHRQTLEEAAVFSRPGRGSQGRFDSALHDRQRRLNLVRHVSGKLAERCERPLQAVEQMIQRADQVADFLVRRVDIHPPGQVGCLNLLKGGSD